MGDLERDTRVARVDTGESDGHVYTAELSPDWEIWGPNGGYLATVALRACGATAEIARPVSVTCHFLRRGAFAPVEVRVEVLARGRRSESLGFTVAQDGRRLAAGMLRTAAPGPGLEHDVCAPPELPGPEGLATLEALDPGHVVRFPFWANLDRKPPDPSWVGRPPAPRPPTSHEWLRFRPRATFADDPFLDAARALILIDTFTWPCAVGPHAPSDYTAPNIDLHVWFHQPRPESAWLLIDAESPVAAGGLMATHARVWSEDRTLVASGGAQLLCVPPAGPAQPTKTRATAPGSEAT